MYGQIPFNFPNTMGLASNKNLFNLGSSFFKKINWSALLTNTGKVLNLTNQAIPLYYQVKPIFKNIKTFGKITREFNKNNANITKNINDSPIKDKTHDNEIPEPVFFI